MASLRDMKKKVKKEETIQDRLIRESIDKIGKALEKAWKKKDK